MRTAAATLARDSRLLVGAAMHRHKALSFDGLQERIFSWAFRDLVYPQIWEDPRVDLAALELTPQSRLVTIASGGCNVLNYLTAGPERIFAVDLNAAHVALNKLKYASVRHLADYRSFFQLFGHAAAPANGKLFDEQVAPHLDAETFAYWATRNARGRPRIEQFQSNFYRAGLLGCFIGAAHAMARCYGQNPQKLTSARSRTEQIALFERDFAPLFDRPSIRFLLGHRAALFGLGIPPAQYEALLDGQGHMADVVRERLRKLACDFELSDNYFAWQAFARHYSRDGAGPLPPYLQEANFAPLKSGIDRVSIEHGSLTEFLERQSAASLDRYVLLDAQDWMDAPTLTRLWTEITRTARPASRVIFRTAGRETVLPGRVPERVLGAWVYQDRRSKALLAEDRSAVYGGFHLYERKG